MSLLVPFLIYWLLLFVGCYLVVEVGQKHYYDGVTPHAWLKVGAATLALSAVLTWWNPSSLDLFTVHLGITALLAILGFGIFVLVYRFHPPHAALLGPLTIIVVVFAASMAVESWANSGRAGFQDRPAPAAERTIRKAVGGSPEFKTPEPAKKAAPTAP